MTTSCVQLSGSTSSAESKFGLFLCQPSSRSSKGEESKERQRAEGHEHDNNSQTCTKEPSTNTRDFGLATTARAARRVGSSEELTTPTRFGLCADVAPVERAVDRDGLEGRQEGGQRGVASAGAVPAREGHGVGVETLRAVLEIEPDDRLAGSVLTQLQSNSGSVVDCTDIGVRRHTTVQNKARSPIAGGRAPFSTTPVTLNKLRNGL